MSDLVNKLRISLKEIMDIRKGEVALIVYDDYAKDVCDITGKALEREGVTVYEYLLPGSQRPLTSTPDDLAELLGMARPDLVFNQFKGIAEETPFRISLHWRRIHVWRQSRAFAGHQHGHDRAPDDRGL